MGTNKEPWDTVELRVTLKNVRGENNDGVYSLALKQFMKLLNGVRERYKDDEGKRHG